MGFGEIIFIMVIALILFGPDDLPKVARVIGKIIYEFRKLTNDLTKEFQNFIETPEPPKTEKWSENYTEVSPLTSDNQPLSGNLQQKGDTMQQESATLQPEVNADAGAKTDVDASSNPNANVNATNNAPELGTSNFQPEISPAQLKNPDPLAELPKDMVSYEEKGVRNR